MSVIKFDPQQLERIAALLEDLPDPAGMDREALEQARQQVENAIDQLNELEPRNENSEIYEDWAALHEDLEDALDDILDDLE